MSLLAPGLSARIKGFPNRKPPALLPFSPGHVAPEWKWFWDGVQAVWPVFTIFGGEAGNDAVNSQSIFPNQLGPFHVPENSTGSKLLPTHIGPALRVGDGTGSQAWPHHWQADTGLPFITPGSEGTVVFHHRSTMTPTNLDTYVKLGLIGDGANANIGWLFIARDTPGDMSFEVFQGASRFFARGNANIIDEDFLDIGTWQIGGRLKLHQNGVETADAAAPTSGSLNFDASWGVDLGNLNNVNSRAAQFNLYYLAILNIKMSPGQISQLNADPFGPLRTRSLPLFLPAVAADTFDTALLGSSSPRWDSRMRFY